tara:strand:+ start:673 stop:1812 length:1140 start_codon:yes stop_codon:yes gene_type:complete
MLNNKRIHALDALRGIMMLLGVVLHTAITFSSSHYPGWPIHSETNHIFFDWLFGVIHIFRMPIFFIVSGFFAAFLFYNKSPKIMIRNRLKRIFLPFIIFVFILTPIARLCIKFSTNALKVDESNVLAFNVWEHINLFTFIPFNTMHLWFLYYLMLFSIVPILINAIILKSKKMDFLKQYSNRTYDYVLSNSILKISILPVITSVILYVSNSIWIDASISFIPSIKTFMFYFLFYIFGWFLFKSNNLMEYFKEGSLFYTIFGVIVFTLSFLFFEILENYMLIILNAFSTWLFIYGLVGLFLKYLNFHNNSMKYLLDASYWIYLIHLPLTILLPGLINHFTVPISLKFIIIITIVFFISIASYHLFVRKTIIGVLLNGRKY